MAHIYEKKPLVSHDFAESESHKPSSNESADKGDDADEYQIDLEECIAKAGSLR